MATRAVTDEQLQGIADAIKLKSGDDTPMSVDDMALRIGLIEGGVSLPFAEKMSCGTYIPNDNGTMGRYFVHNLGAVPKMFLIYTNDLDDTSSTRIAWELYVSDNNSVVKNQKAAWLAYNSTATETIAYRSFGTNYGINPLYIDESKVYISGSGTQYTFQPGAHYNWIAIA